MNAKESAATPSCRRKEKPILSSHVRDIKAKNVALRYEGKVDNEFTRGLRKYLKRYNIKDFLLTRDGVIVMHRSRTLHIRSCLRTLAGHLKLEGKEDLLHRLEMPQPAPDTLLRQLFPDGYDSERIRLRMGERFSPTSINRMCGKETVEADNNTQERQMAEELFGKFSAGAKLSLKDFLGFVLRVRTGKMDEGEIHEWRQMIAENPSQLVFLSFLTAIQVRLDIQPDTWCHLRQVFHERLLKAARIIWPDSEWSDDDDEDEPVSKRPKIEL